MAMESPSMKDGFGSRGIGLLGLSSLGELRRDTYLATICGSVMCGRGPEMCGMLSGWPLSLQSLRALSHGWCTRMDSEPSVIGSHGMGASSHGVSTGSHGMVLIALSKLRISKL